MFVLRFYDPDNPIGSCRAWSLQPTLQLGRLCPLSGLPVLCKFFLQKTDNCPSWISGRETMTIENISWSNLHEKLLPDPAVSNPQPSFHQSDANLTELPRPATVVITFYVWITHFAVMAFFLCLVGHYNDRRKVFSDSHALSSGFVWWSKFQGETISPPQVSALAISFTLATVY